MSSACDGRPVRCSPFLSGWLKGFPMEVDLGNLKPTVLSALTLLLMIMVIVPVAKYVLNRWQVPGLTELINAV
jgi:hypothetical protein